MSTTTTTTEIDERGPISPAPPAPPATTTVPWVLDLVTGASSTPKPAAITITTPPTALTGAYAGWMRAGLKINLGDKYKQVNFVVEYEGTPEGYSLNIGDSPTNDGWSGDAGSASCAELQVGAQTLRVYGKAYAPGHCHTYGTQNYVLQDGSLKVVVRDKFVSVGQPYMPMQDEELYQLPDVGRPDGFNIYAAFNSVVTQRSDRFGKGLRRVMITLQ
jgi:hypothetical protein